jgi:hypothetical protein
MVFGPAATWDVNPIYDVYDRIDHPGSATPIPNVPAFVAAFDTDPADARAKYQCLPEKATNPFFKSEESLMNCFYTVPRQPIEIGYRLVGGAWTVDYDVDSANLRPKAGARYACHVDLAVVGDRAGIAMAHVSEWQEVTTMRLVWVRLSA